MTASLLHVGCGGDSRPEWLSQYVETRLDIDPRHDPDIVASMVELGEIGPFDAVYCSHALEHLFPHEVETALSEFQRVLKPGGVAYIFVPDLEGVDATDEVLFDSPAGKITGLDLIYGLRHALKDQPYMAHKTGFMLDTLFCSLTKAGFSRVKVDRHSCHNLFGVAIK